MELEESAPGPESTAPSIFETATPETTTAPEVESVLQESTDTGTEDQGDLTAEELEEIEFEGKKAKVPKEFKDGFMRQRDYTQKTQTHAEERRAFEAQQADFQRMAQLQQATFAESAQVYAIDERLASYRKLDWNALTDADPKQAMSLERDMRNLESQRTQLVQGISQKQQHLTFSQQQEIARRAEEGQRELARDIKGWSPELRDKLGETAKAFGYRPEELAQVSDPRAVKLLHEAYLYRQLMAKQTAKPAPAPLPKPVSKVSGGGATNTKALSDMSAQEHAKWRQERRNPTRR